jgi:hypothetical protein
MSRLPAVSAWEAVVSRQFPSLSRPQAGVLALWSLGVVVAQRCGQTSVVAAVAGLVEQSEGTVRQRLREWCYAASDKAGSRRGIQRREVEVTLCFAPLLGWVLQWWGARDAHRLALALDASSLGARFTVLALSVLYRGCAIPVAWVVVRAQEPGAWRPHWEGLLRQMRGSIPSDWVVVTLADRGLYAPWLFEAIVTCGWHPFLRITAGSGPNSGLYRPLAGGSWRRLADLLPQVGAQWSGPVVCFAEHSLPCTLLARWEAGYREGWLVLTDLAPAVAAVAWYGLRSWIEAGFKDTKRGGWQWQATRMTDPARVSRFWLVLAVATLWVVSVGSVAEDAAPCSHLEALPATHVARLAQLARAARRQATGDATPRRLSCFRRGVSSIVQRLIAGRALPLGRFCPEPWPTNLGAAILPRSGVRTGQGAKTYP